MENKKDIGKLFKAKLDGLEKSPNAHLWAGINEELQEKKKKRRIVPFYYYYTCAALLLIFIGFATKLYWMPAFENFSTIENSSTTIEGNSHSTDSNDQNSISNQQLNSTAIEGKTVDTERDFNLNSDETIIVNSEDPLNSRSENNIQSTYNNSSQSNSGTVTKDNSKINPQSASKSNSENVSTINSKNNSTTSTKTISQKSSLNKNNKAVSPKSRNNNDKINNNSNSNVRSNDDIITRNLGDLDNNSSISALTQDGKTTTLESDNETIANFEGITNETLQQNDSIKVDSIAIKRKAKMELRLAAQKKADSIKAAKPKFYVFAHAGVTAFNHFGSQSFIDPRLDNYDTNIKLQYNYGIYFGLIANDKLSIRIGLNKTSLSLTTKDVPLTSTNPNTEIWGYFSNIDYNMALSNAQLATYFGASNVTLTQNIRFIEIPLEVKYKLYDGEIAIEAIGGISALLLSKNEVKAESDDKFLYLGKVNNGRQASASINLGAGFNYKIAKNLQLNVEPMFKYYFRSFEVANKPYSLNFQAGLQYDFSLLNKHN